MKNCSFRCRSPILYNDPFDCSLENIHLGINKKVTPVINWLSNRRLSLIEQTELTTEVCDEVSIQQKKSSEYKKISMLLNCSAIFCLSESFDNILMWSHYSDSHTGAVIEVNLAESSRNNGWLSAAKPVSYSNIAPYDYNSLIYTKAKCWEYEQEWRVNHAEEFSENIPYPNREIDYKFNPSEISSIIFGIKAEQNEIKDAVKLIMGSDFFSHIKFFQMQRKVGFFQVYKESINTDN